MAEPTKTGKRLGGLIGLYLAFSEGIGHALVVVLVGSLIGHKPKTVRVVDLVAAAFPLGIGVGIILWALNWGPRADMYRDKDSNLGGSIVVGILLQGLLLFLASLIRFLVEGENPD